MTLATQFAETTRYSATSPELRRRVLQLYRRYIRSSREFANLYELDMPVSSIKTKIRQEFERQRFVDDLAIRNVLYMKGQMEFQELINFWKQQCHVLRYFDDQNAYNTIDKNDFVKNFLRGNWVLEEIKIIVCGGVFIYSKLSCIELFVCVCSLYTSWNDDVSSQEILESLST